MEISDLSAILNTVAADWQSDQSAGATGTQSTALDFKSMTVSQFRDVTDQLDREGKLTTEEDLALIGDGLRDLNLDDLSYQPASNTGYNRSDTSTYNFIGMMSGAAEFSASMGNTQMANVYQGITNILLKEEESVDNNSSAPASTTAG